MNLLRLQDEVKVGPLPEVDEVVDLEKPLGAAPAVHLPWT